MTGMFLEGGRIIGRPLFTGHFYINNLMALICAVCVPWMLLVKPIILYKENEKKIKMRQVGGDVEMRAQRYEIS